MNALIIVDLQNDFMPGGALAVDQGDQVVGVANRLMPHFDFVVATQDWHPRNHKSFASQHPGKQIGDSIRLREADQILWPDHCIQDSQGAKFHAVLDQQQIDVVVQKGTQVDIDSYSGFFDNDHQYETGLRQLLTEKGVSKVGVLGLATDYCVRFTALDAVQVGFQTYLIEDGCRGVDLRPGDVIAALQEMQEAGIIISDSANCLDAMA